MKDTSLIKKADSAKKNFAFQIVYQLVIIVLPLVIAPYLTRVVGEVNLGYYAFTFSIAYYFVVFANLGIGKHGQRIIATRREDPIALRKAFWSLFSVHSFVSLISLFLFLLLCFFAREVKILYFIQSIYVLSALFDITWFFYGMENFKSVVIKNLILKVLESVLIFLFVKSASDIHVYTLIMAGSSLVGYVVLFPQAIRWVKPIRFSKEDVREHVKPLLILSVAVISSSMYTIFDKTLLGLMSSKENVAFYEYSNKIINIPKSIITVIGTVLFPKACASFANGDKAGMTKYFRYGIIFTYFLGFASLFGLLSVSNLFATLYFGDNFSICGDVMKIMCPVVLIISLSDIVKMQFLIPMNKDKQYIVISIIAAIINVCLSIALIPLIDIYGAIVATIISEVFNMVALLVVCKKYIDFKFLIGSLIPFVISGFFMFGILEMVKNIFNSSLLHLIVQLIVGALCYSISVLLWFLFLSKNKKITEIGNLVI